MDSCASQQCQNKELQASCCPQAGNILGGIHLTERRRGNDASNGTESNLQCTSNKPLRLHADIIRLVGEDGRDVSLTPSSAEEYAKVANAGFRVVCSDHKVDDANDTLRCNNGATEAVLVSHQGKGVRGDNCKNNRRCRKEICDSSAISQALQIIFC